MRKSGTATFTADVPREAAAAASSVDPADAALLLYRKMQHARSRKDMGTYCSALYSLYGHPGAASALYAMLLSSNFASPSNNREARAIAELYHLLFVIDEKKALSAAKELQTSRDPVVRSAINAASSFLEAHLQRELGELSIRVHREIYEPEKVLQTVEQWLKLLPSDDLRGLKLVYVTPPGHYSTQELLGLYAASLRTVSIMWERPGREPGRLFYWGAQATLYHEIGHHRHNHQPGADAQLRREQEAAAEAYALLHMRRVYPALRILRGTGKLLIALHAAPLRRKRRRMRVLPGFP